MENHDKRTGGVTMQLRQYQADCVEAVLDHIFDGQGSGLAVIPTAGGKTHVIADVIRQCCNAGGRVLMATHVSELIEQAESKLKHYIPDTPIGVYSAKLGSRQSSQKVILAGIQSIYSRAFDLGKFNVMLIDEAHLVPPEGDGMYRQFLKDARIVNPAMKLEGFTATPYRMGFGSIAGNGAIFDEIVYEIGVKDLIDQGYLCPLVSRGSSHAADMTGVNSRRGDFVQKQADERFECVLKPAVEEMLQLTASRRKVIIFASGVENARKIKIHIEAAGFECGIAVGKDQKARDESVARFKGRKASLLDDRPELKYLVNCDILTTGFDCPEVDCVVLLRATQSPGLFYQMVGRGFRLSPSKQDCLILDYGGNVSRHGPVDMLGSMDRKKRSESKVGEAPQKECPECHVFCPAGCSNCPECDFEFPFEENKNISETAAADGVLSGQACVDEYNVGRVYYSVHNKKVKKGEEDLPPKPPTMRVDYCEFESAPPFISEWIGFEHTGYFRSKAVDWWMRRSDLPMPKSVAEAVDLCNAGKVAEPWLVRVQKKAGEKFPEIVGVELAEPDDEEEGVFVGSEPVDLDDVPF